MSATGSRIKIKVKHSRKPFESEVAVLDASRHRETHRKTDGRVKLRKRKRRRDTRLTSTHGDQPISEALVESLSPGPTSQREPGAKRSMFSGNKLGDDQPPTSPTTSCDDCGSVLELAKARAEILELRQQLVEKSRRISSGFGLANANVNSNYCDAKSAETESLVDTRDEINHYLVKEFFGNVMIDVSSIGRDLGRKSNKELVEFRDRLLAKRREASQYRDSWIPKGSQYEKVDAKRLKSAEGIIAGYVKKTEAVLFEDRYSFLCYCAELGPNREDQRLYDVLDGHTSSPSMSPNSKEAEDSILEELRKRVIFEDIPEDSESDSELIAETSCCEDANGGAKSPKVDRPYSPSDAIFSIEDVEVGKIQISSTPEMPPRSTPKSLENKPNIVQSRSADKTKKRIGYTPETSNTKLIPSHDFKPFAITSSRSSIKPILKPNLVFAPRSPNDDKSTLSLTIPRESNFSALLDASIYESMNGVSPSTSPTRDNTQLINSTPNQAPRSNYNSWTSTRTNKPNLFLRTYINKLSPPQSTCTNVPNLTQSISTNIPNLSQSTCIKKPCQTQSTYTNVPNLTQSTFTNVPNLTQSTCTNVPNLTQSICTNVPNLTQSTCTNVPNLTQSTCTNVPNLTQSTCTNVPNLTQSTCTNVPNLTQSTCTNVPNLTQSTCTNVPNLTQSTCTNAPNITQSTYTNTPNLSQSTCIKKPSQTQSIYTNKPNPTQELFSQYAGGGERGYSSSVSNQRSSSMAGPVFTQSFGVGLGPEATPSFRFPNDSNNAQFLQFDPNSSLYSNDYWPMEAYGHRQVFYY